MHAASLFLLLATIGNWMIAAAWAWRAAELARNLPRVPDLLGPRRTGAGTPLGPQHRLAVIVPACNEEAAIGETLRSLLKQEGVALDVIAVDDRSKDRTGAIMDALAAETAADPEKVLPNISLTVLHVRSLPEGWMGKQNALARGVAATDAPYLLFTDGDIFFRQDALRRAMEFMVSERADHLVLIPTPIVQGLGEHMMISALQVYSALAVRLWRVPDPDRKDRLGVGAFNLVRREAYDALGGFAALRMEVLEDVRLGVEIKRHRLRQRVALGAGLVTLRWAEGVSGVVRNVTKNFFAAFQFVVWRTVLAAAALAITGIFPAIGFFGPPAMQLASFVSLAALITIYWLFRRPGGSSPAYALLFPIATVCIVYAMLRSMLVTLARGAVEWRGTRYSLAELRRQSGPLF